MRCGEVWCGVVWCGVVCFCVFRFALSLHSTSCERSCPGKKTSCNCGIATVFSQTAWNLLDLYEHIVNGLQLGNLSGLLKWTKGNSRCASAAPADEAEPCPRPPPGEMSTICLTVCAGKPTICSTIRSEMLLPQESVAVVLCLGREP